MEQSEINIGNDLISSFMGLKEKEPYSNLHGEIYWHKFPVEKGGCTTAGLKYHSDWNWLKRVVDKIFTYSLAHREQTEPIRSMKIVVDILPCWQCCVDFIIWHNSLTPTTKGG